MALPQVRIRIDGPETVGIVEPERDVAGLQLVGACGNRRWPILLGGPQKSQPSQRKAGTELAAEP